ncbi:MAG: sigma-70 family RNA polymerase sigma factor [Planctomycetota bacterium]
MAGFQKVTATVDQSTLDRSTFQDSLQQHRDRLRRLVEIRLDPRVRGRVDASDVIQETQLEAHERAEEYLGSQEVPFFVWLRFLALQKLAQAHRRHLGTKARDAGREVSIHAPLVSAATSAALAAQLVGQLTTASQAAVRAEVRVRLEQALGKMDPMDREVLSLRHFEQLSQKETANVLKISEKAAGSRHIRALARLRKLVSE